MGGAAAGPGHRSHEPVLDVPQGAGTDRGGGRDQGCRLRRHVLKTSGRVPEPGWFVLNMRDAVWRHVDGRGAVCTVADDFEGERQFEQLGVNPFVLNPGEPMALYHWEADQ